jgi:hypothetical protein
MKRGQLPHGYTIVEVMIFLVVTGALLVSALALFNGQHRRTQYTQAIREMDSQIRAIANEVQSGYYPNLGNVQCTVSGSGPSLQNVTTAKGSNQSCIFLGRVIQFGSQGTNCTASSPSDCTQYTIHTVFGRRLDSNGQLAQTLEDPDGAGAKSGAQPRLAVPATGQVDLSDKRDIPGNLKIYKMYEVRGGAVTTIGSVGFIYPLSIYTSGNSDPVSGSRSVNLVGMAGTALGQDANTAEATSVQNLNEGQRDPDQVVLCFTEAGLITSRKSAIVIGGQGKQLTTQVYNDVTNGTTIPGNAC